MDIDIDLAKSNARAIVRSLRILVSIVSENLSNAGRFVFHDFAFFMRLAVADAAEQVSESARNAANALRKVDNDVTEGQRNEAGMKCKVEGELEDADARAKFERSIDFVRRPALMLLVLVRSPRRPLRTLLTARLHVYKMSTIRNPFFSSRFLNFARCMPSLRSPAGRRRLPQGHFYYL